ncbi:hypothetical protein ODJ79_44650 [Actinoplanes sp. KI2]|uniref:hypothetical protein n=1 Tax=Actinoplanes sp. KI2 TaxID=2983315 RepID=UPI0021D60544|nr:hypothetical protein [Actinoplanes sp. KI2]MCU7730849.1 hypothetical protein [Actinoplanes sp. KI2]
MLLVATVAGLLTAATAGCTGQTKATTPPAAPASTPAAAGVADEAAIYVQVLRRYLDTPSDNSFAGHTFSKVYLLDHYVPDAGDPDGPHERGTPIGPDAQRQFTTALAPEATVAFVADRNTVIETRDGCPQVRDGGILITLGPATGDDHEVRVAVNGFVACLGATWLTYVVHNEPGSGWRVTGTTGSMAIS